MDEIEFCACGGNRLSVLINVRGCVSVHYSNFQTICSQVRIRGLRAGGPRHFVGKVVNLTRIVKFHNFFGHHFVFPRPFVCGK